MCICVILWMKCNKGVKQRYDGWTKLKLTIWHEIEMIFFLLDIVYLVIACLDFFLCCWKRNFRLLFLVIYYVYQ